MLFSLNASAFCHDIVRYGDQDIKISSQRTKVPKYQSIIVIKKNTATISETDSLKATDISKRAAELFCYPQ